LTNEPGLKRNPLRVKLAPTLILLGTELMKGSMLEVGVGRGVREGMGVAVGARVAV
jgi:hypothetical protein